MKGLKKNKYVLVQICIVLILAVAVLIVSYLTYSNGIYKEEPFLSGDSNSPQYYMNVLNSENIKFACNIGSDYESLIKEKFPNAEITMVTAWDELITRLNYGKSDAILMEATSVKPILESIPSMYFFDEAIMSCEYCYFTAKTEWGDTLCSQINQFIVNLNETGEYEQLKEKWLNSTESDYEMEKVSFKENGKVLNIVIEPDWMPLSFFPNLNSGPVGYFVDQINLFCQAYGYVPNYISVSSFDSCSMGINTGKYDIAAVGLVYSEERKEKYNITSPIFEDEVCVGVRASSVIGLDFDEYVKDTDFWQNIGASLYKNLIQNDRWQMLLKGLLNTVIMSFGSVIFGTVVGIIVYFLRKQNNVILSSIGRLYVNIFQRMPQVLLLLILCYVVFTGENTSGITVCIVSFGLSFAPFVSEMLRSGVDAIPDGQWRASSALGFTKTQTFFKIILPQVMQIIMPVYKGDVVTLILETSIAGYIAVEDLTKMSDYIRSSTLEPLTPMLVTSIVYFVLTLCIGLLLGRVEKLLDKKSYRRLPKWVLKEKEKSENT